jgi:hypothetical protein
MRHTAFISQHAHHERSATTETSLDRTPMITLEPVPTAHARMAKFDVKTEFYTL